MSSKKIFDCKYSIVLKNVILNTIFRDFHNSSCISFYFYAFLCIESRLSLIQTFQDRFISGMFNIQKLVKNVN